MLSMVMKTRPTMPAARHFVIVLNIYLRDLSEPILKIPTHQKLDMSRRTLKCGGGVKVCPTLDLMLTMPCND